MKTCREITEMIEKAGISRLRISERIAVKAHLRICRNCRQYSKDSRLLEKMLREARQTVTDIQFSEVEKKSLIIKLGGDQ